MLSSAAVRPVRLRSEDVSQGDGAEPLSTYQQRLMEVYMPPEFHNSNMEPTLAGDVFRYPRGGRSFELHQCPGN